jgi:simple sugar transport system permease protein
LETGSPASRWIWLFRAAFIVAGLGVGGAVIQSSISTGDNVYQVMLQGSVGTSDSINYTITLTTPLILTGAAAAFAYRIGLWNVGIEGQLFIGAWAGMAVALTFPKLDGQLLVPAMFVAAASAGAFWVLVPALARAYLRASEVITTLMLNFVATLWVSYYAAGAWRDPHYVGAVASVEIPSQTRLPTWQIAGLGVYSGLVLAIVLVLILWALLRFTRYGYQVRIVGDSEQAATYAGMKVRWQKVSALLISGAVGGLAGVVEMTAVVHRLSSALSNNTGYTGIVIAVIAGGSIVASILIAGILGGLASAGNSFTVLGVTPNALFVVTALVLLFAALGERFSHLRVSRAGIRLTQIQAGTSQTPAIADQSTKT